jgi:phosphoribosyl 1,2-cyclic phosphate phosphodiesterase
MIGCDCEVCRSDDPRDKRMRPSIFIELEHGLTVLVDTTPDLRTQALTHGLRRVDALLFTHSHIDHVAGLDETRRFTAMSRAALPVYGDAPTLADIQRIFSYAFERGKPGGGGVPDLRLWTIGGPFCLAELDVIPVPIQHGHRMILGYRLGGLAYLTDCSGIPESSLALLGGVDTLVLDALRRRPHPTHFNLDQAVGMARRIGARRTFFTHIAHELGHAATCAALPAGMALAYDGLALTLPTGQ